VGFVHQSNGRGADAYSRSWNRVYANLVFERGNFACALKPWWRIPEDEADDNNPNIEKYYGYGELRAAYKWSDMVFAVMLRNNLRADGNKGAVQLDWSFPLPGSRRLKGYVQFFNGYGESMIDYDHANQRIGAGILLSDWL
jgi:phospholipase A1